MESKYIRADLFWNKIAGSSFFSAAEKAKIQMAIENEPSEDVAPVIHAHWIPCNPELGDSCDNYKCSACGEIRFLSLGTPLEDGFKYCPACGAKMDEEITK